MLWNKLDCAILTPDKTDFGAVCASTGEFDGIYSGFSSSSILEKYRLGSKSNIARIENVLLGKELIDKRTDGVYFADPVFAFWFHREYCV